MRWNSSLLPTLFMLPSVAAPTLANEHERSWIRVGV